jgi:3-oxoadipate enol-lactonase
LTIDADIDIATSSNMRDKMPFLEIDGGTAIHYEYHPPQEGRVTFVFCNSMGLSTAFWHDNVTPALRDRGFGTLAFDYRGQGKTRYDSTATFEPDQIVADIGRVVKALSPPRAVLVGISIGGQYAAQAILQGADAAALVMSNSLRKAGAHTEWIIELEARLLAMGGMQLAEDCIDPVISGKERLAAIRPTHLRDTPYMPFAEDHPRLRIQHGLKKYRWDVEYERLTLPVLVMTGMNDRLFRIQDDVDELLARLPNARSAVFPEAGHVLHREIPGQLVDLFTDFAAAV